MEWQVWLFNGISKIFINPLTLRISQGLTAGCSAVGGMEWQFWLFNGISEIFIYPLTLHISQGLTAGCSAEGGGWNGRFGCLMEFLKYLLIS